MSIITIFIFLHRDQNCYYIAIHGKRVTLDCKNHCGINLLSVVGKLYAKVLIERVMNETDEFRKGMGMGVPRGGRAATPPRTVRPIDIYVHVR